MAKKIEKSLLDMSAVALPDDVVASKNDEPEVAAAEPTVEQEKRGKKKEPPGVVPKSLMSMLGDSAAKHFGQRVYTADQQQKRMFGIEPYPLALQWVWHSNVLPLQQIISFEGPPKTYKTSTALEIARWFLGLGGKAVYIGTEGKLSPTKITSMLGPLTDKLELAPCDSVEEWQDVATYYITKMGEIADLIRAKRKDSDKKVREEYAGAYLEPLVIIVDSIGGVQSETMFENIQGEGHASKTFQDRALLNTMWLNTYSSRLTGLPITVVLLNHLKDAMNQTGHGEKKVAPGGIGMGFHTSLCTRVNRVGEINKEDGADLIWKVFFSSIGIDKRELNIPYIESFDEHDNQLCFFDWDKVLVLLLKELKCKPNYTNLDTLLGDMVDYSAGSKGKVYSCGLLGVKGEKQAKEGEWTAQKIGSALQSDATIRTKLQAAMRIPQYTVWKQGYDLEIPREELGGGDKKKKGK